MFLTSLFITRGVARWMPAMCLGLWSAVAAATPLDDYVAAPDAAYQWHVANTIYLPSGTAHVLYMVSQNWRSSAEVDRTLWEHWLTVVVPTTVTRPTALLYISGGSNSASVPTSVASELVMIASETGSIVAGLRQIPNQPLTFRDDGTPRWEDEIIAYCWDKHLRGGDDWWPTRLPMTKASVRAMDAVQAFSRVHLGRTISDFVVTGASKRGWTTWTTAAVDRRVRAIIPLVIDVLNVEPSFRHHYAVYGFWAPAVHDYEEMGIMDWMGTQEMRELMAIVDPYSYRARYTMPKYIVNSPGDQFFLPDSSQFYFDDLPGEKYLRYVPNTDHGLNTAAVEGLISYYNAILNNAPRPLFSWTEETDGALRIHPVTTPSQVLLWQATNPNARDFRLEQIGAAWTAAALSYEPSGDYVARVSPPRTGWTAYFAELTFPSAGARPLVFTTDVHMVAQTHRPIVINGDFTDWAVVPSYYDPAGDPHDTDHSGPLECPVRVEHPDVDILEYKFAHDTENLYAYFRASGQIGRTQTTAQGRAGRYYAIVTIDVDRDEATGYGLHEGGYYPTSSGYDMNMEIEWYNGAYNTGHYINHGCRNAAELAQAFEDQARGIVRVLPGSYEYYTQWVMFDDGSIEFVEDGGPVYYGIIRVAVSPDGHEMEMVAPFRGFMRDPLGDPIVALGKNIKVSFSLEASGELAPGGQWASDTAEPIRPYYLRPEGIPPVISVTPSNHNIGPSGGNVQFNVQDLTGERVAWSATVLEGREWLALSMWKVAGDGRILATCAANSHSNPRVGTIRVTPALPGGNIVDVTVTQAGFTAPRLVVIPSVQNVGAAAGSTLFQVSKIGTATLNWRAALVGQSDWLGIHSGSQGTDAGTIEVHYQANLSQQERTAVIRVTAAGALDSPQNVTVTQAACQVPAPPSNVQATDGAYSDKVRVTWGASGLGGVTYRVYRSSTQNTSDALPVSSWITGTSFDDFSVEAARAAESGCQGATQPGPRVYYYCVKARNLCGESGFSAFDAGHRSSAKRLSSRHAGYAGDQAILVVALSAMAEAGRRWRRSHRQTRHRL